MELRCRLLDRFGDLQHLPAIRCLYLDSDPDALQKATAGTSEGYREGSACICVLAHQSSSAVRSVSRVSWARCICASPAEVDRGSPGLGLAALDRDGTRAAVLRTGGAAESCA